MLKKILLILALLYAGVSFAAVDANKATAAELDGIKGIGPAISSKILDERKKGAFKDWADFIGRVKGVGETSAAHFSAEGLTVNGATYNGAPAKKAESKKATEKMASDTKAAPATKPADAKKAKTDASAAPAAPAAAPAASAGTAKK